MSPIYGPNQSFVVSMRLFVNMTWMVSNTWNSNWNVCNWFGSISTPTKTHEIRFHYLFTFDITGSCNFKGINDITNLWRLKIDRISHTWSTWFSNDTFIFENFMRLVDFILRMRWQSRILLAFLKLECVSECWYWTLPFSTSFMRNDWTCNLHDANDFLWFGIQ